MLTEQGVSRLLHTASVIFFMIVMQSLSYSQLRSVPTVSNIEEFILQTPPHFPQFISYSNQKSRDLIFHDASSSKLTIAMSNLDGTFGETKIVDTIHIVTSFTTGNLNNDGIDDIIVVQRETNRIIVFLSNSFDSIYAKQIFQTNFYPEQVLIADISGDRINDIIVYGKLASGVTVFRGKGNNKFIEAKIVFQGIPVSSFSIIQLNGDDQPDVAVHNWLSNEDVFYFGLGGLQFSEQSALSYGTDSTTAMFADVNNDGITDVVVTSTQYQSFLVYHSDGLGSFVREQNISLLQSATLLEKTSFTGEEIPDFLLASETQGQFSLLLNKGDGLFYDEIVFGLPYQHFTILSEDINSDGYTDVVCFNTDSGNYTIFWNQRTVAINSKKNKVAVGKLPNDLYVSDINSDGYDDVVVSNERSNTLSIVLGTLAAPNSQLSIEIPDKPSSVSVYSKSDSSITFVTSHSGDSKIGITILSRTTESNNALLSSVESYTIPLAGKPTYVLPDISLQSIPISLYVFSRGQTNSIVFYQQLRSTQFVAKSLTPLISSRIMFATISDLNGDGFTDLTYVYNDKRTNTDVLSTTLNDKKGEFAGTTFTLSLPDTGNRRSFFVIEDLNSDQQKDYLFYSSSQKTLNCILGKKNGEFSTVAPVTNNVMISRQDMIQLYDYDTDGLIDIVYLDSESLALRLLRGRGNGTFFKNQILFELPKNTVFRCGDFNGDGNSDIVFIQPEQNSIEFRYGAKN